MGVPKKPPAPYGYIPAQPPYSSRVKCSQSMGVGAALLIGARLQVQVVVPPPPSGWGGTGRRCLS